MLFDLFTIEFPPDLLDFIGLTTLFYQKHYQKMTQSSLSIVLLSAFQARLVNGKSFDEIREFNSILPFRRKLKLEMSRVRGRLQNLSKEADSFLLNLSSTANHSLLLLPGADEYFGVRTARLSSTLEPYANKSAVNQVVDSFFAQYSFKEVSFDLLRAFNTFLARIPESYRTQLEKFVDGNFDWAMSKELVELHLKSLEAWLVDEEHHKKKLAAADSEEEEYIQVEKLRNKTPLEAAFIDFLNAMDADDKRNHKMWLEILKPINVLISKNDEYKSRFGPVPGAGLFSKLSDKASGLKDKLWSSTKESEKKDVEQAKFIIKIFFLSKSILAFNRDLYVYNTMMLNEKRGGHFSDDLLLLDDDYNQFSARFDSYIDKCDQTPINTEDGACEEYMKHHGLNCAAFRYLLVNKLQVKIFSYRQAGYQTLRVVEALNPRTSSSDQTIESLWLRDDGQPPVGIAADSEFRQLVGSHASMIGKYRASLLNLSSMIKRDDFASSKKSTSMNKLVSFFDEPSLRASACEWIEAYMAATHDQSLVQLINIRMWLDGCHLSLFEFQSILSLLITLISFYKCELNYLLLLANSVDQTKLLDVLLYLRIEYQLGRRLSADSKLLALINAIQSSRYKSMLAVKLASFNDLIDEDDLAKIMLMLQNASNGAEQLEKIGLEEWIAIAREQKWSEIGCMLKQYGSIGYYLGLLDQKGFKSEEARMRELFDKSVVIPEKLVALASQWIVMRERDVDVVFDELGEYLAKAIDFPSLNDRETKHQLITSEREQSELLEFMLDGEFYETMCAASDRTIDDLVEKVVGLHDTEQQAIERRDKVRRIAGLFKDPKCESVKWLKKFDNALYQLRKIRLRDTQRMAILCAVEGGDRVLEQVNTGEGKSLIIAAIASIHLKMGKRYVDVITSSPVLAERDAKEMSLLYNQLGLSVAHNCSEDLEERKKVTR